MADLPPERSAIPAFLDGHIRHTMAFYHPRCIDRERGGFFHFFTRRRQHLRRRHAPPGQQHPVRLQLRHGVPPLRRSRLPGRRRATASPSCATRIATRPPAATLGCSGRDDAVLDGTNHCYGLAFVVLAYAKALEAGVDEARDHLDETWDLMERHFWSRSGRALQGRDQRRLAARSRPIAARTPTCIAARRCSRPSRPRASTAISTAPSGSRGASRSTSPARPTGWSGSTTMPSWNVDWDYNRDDPKHLFRPWGFQPGHQTEWAKLLLILERHRPADWLLPDRPPPVRHRACSGPGTPSYGGICYGFAPDQRSATATSISGFRPRASPPRRCWPRAPARSATGSWYDRIWDYSWRHMVDHEYGAWFRILDHRNEKYTTRRARPARPTTTRWAPATRC